MHLKGQTRGKWKLIYSYNVRSILWPIIDPILVTFGQICHFSFRDPNLVTFYFYELTHFSDWMNSNLLFICSTNILALLLTVNTKNRLTPQKTKMSDPILVTPLQMRPHYSQSSRKNATPSRAQQFPTFEKWETENRRLTKTHYWSSRNYHVGCKMMGNPRFNPITWLKTEKMLRLLAKVYPYPER